MVHLSCVEMLPNVVLSFVPMFLTTPIITSGNACRDQAVFDGRSSRLILPEPGKKFRHEMGSSTLLQLREYT
jgi:hypothetical protein